MTTRKGSPFREHDSGAAVPRWRSIHVGHPSPYLIPSVALSGEDCPRLSWRFRPVAHFTTSTTSDIDAAAARQNASCFWFDDQPKRLQRHCIGPDGPIQRSTAQRSRPAALASRSRCRAFSSKHGTRHSRYLLRSQNQKLIPSVQIQSNADQRRPTAVHSHG